MKFKVRDGFFLQYTAYETEADGTTTGSPQYFKGGKTVDLDAKVAGDNLHMLEPQDADAQKFHDDRVRPADPAATADFAAAVAAEVARQLAAAGLGKAK